MLNKKKKILLIPLATTSGCFLPLIAVSCGLKIDDIARDLEFEEIPNKENISVNQISEKDIKPKNLDSKFTFKIDGSLVKDKEKGEISFYYYLTGKKGNKSKFYKKTLAGFKKEQNTPADIEKNFKSLTFDLSKEIKNKASNILASSVESSINSFSIKSLDPLFNQTQYNWKVEVNANDAIGKLFAKITMISQTDSAIKSSKILDDLPEIFKKFTNGEIENIALKDNITPVASIQDIAYDLKWDSDVDKYIKYTIPQGENVEFLKRDFTTNGNKIIFKYKISKKIKTPKSFSDNSSEKNISSIKTFEVDFSKYIKTDDDTVQKRLEEIRTYLNYDIDNRSTRLASSITDTKELKPYVHWPHQYTYENLLKEYEITYPDLNNNLVPNDKTGQLTIKAKFTHKVSGKSIDIEKTIDGFKREDSNNFLLYKCDDLNDIYNKSYLLEIKSVKDLINKSKDMNSDELKTFLLKYGTLNESRMNGIDYQFGNLKELSSEVDDELILNYSFNKTAIIGKNPDGSFKREVQQFDRILNLDFSIMISNLWSERVYSYRNKTLAAKAFKKEGYDHNMLPSKFEIDKHYHMPEIENKDLYKNISKSIKSFNDWTGTVEIRYEIEIVGKWKRENNKKFSFTIELKGFKKNSDQ